MAIKLYALSTCPYCMKTKQLLRELGADYEAVDVDLAEEAEADQALEEVLRLTGRQSFPVVVIDDKVIVGFKPEEIMETLRHEQ